MMFCEYPRHQRWTNSICFGNGRYDPAKNEFVLIDFVKKHVHMEHLQASPSTHGAFFASRIWSPHPEQLIDACSRSAPRSRAMAVVVSEYFARNSSNFILCRGVEGLIPLFMFNSVNTTVQYRQCHGSTALMSWFNSVEQGWSQSVAHLNR